jgi:hypothetical protein
MRLAVGVSHAGRAEHGKLAFPLGKFLAGERSVKFLRVGTAGHTEKGYHGFRVLFAILPV